MALLTLKGIQHSYGGPPLLEDINLQIETRERIALIGVNGVGKSTLFGILSGTHQSDAGELWQRQGLRLAVMPQHFPADLKGSVREVICSEFGELGEDLNQYHRLNFVDHTTEIITQQSKLQRRIEAVQGWESDQRVDEVISRLNLDAYAEYAALSGGYQRRVLLARALASDPELLLLDEPTNHLDLETIEWFEKMLLSFQGCVLFTTHDRRFLGHLATRIIELDRGSLSSWPGDYQNYLRRREERLHAEHLEKQRFDKKLAREEVWIRQGIKARRTRNEGRVRKLKALRRESEARRSAPGVVNMRVQKASASGKQVIEVREASAGYGDTLLIKDFSTMIQRGDRVAIMGPNGSGKTTLLKLLLGDLAPTQGEVIAGSNLKLAYFDQHRQQLDEHLSVMDNVAQGRQEVTISGQPKHIISYLQDFLFTPERARSPISVLSGGERNRLLLARLFAEPSNLLVMDEPTNDLDIETLELLEELLSEYTGTLLLVSHDRQFIDNIVTSTLVLEGHGRVGEYVGGYDDWIRQRSEDARAERQARKAPAVPKAKKSAIKRSYKQQRELDLLPNAIEILESKTGELQVRMADSAFYKQDSDAIAATNNELKAAQDELAQLYQRWSELEGS